MGCEMPSCAPRDSNAALGCHALVARASRRAARMGKATTPATIERPALQARQVPCYDRRSHAMRHRHEPDLRRPAHHRLRGHVAPRPRDRRGQSRPGLSGRSGARGRAPQGGRAVRRRLQPISADDGPARAARRHRRPLPALAGRRPRPGNGGHGDLRRDRGARRRPAGADRARRRGRAVRADVRRLPAAGAARRRRAALRHPRSRRPSGSPRRRWRRPSRRRPRSSCSTIRSTRPRRSFRDEDLALLAEFCRRFDADRGLRRGLGARGLRRPPAPAAARRSRACASARSRSARPARSST